MQEAYRQTPYSLTMDWGLSGAAAIGPSCDVAVVVDVLSFTTTLTVAADRGALVFPYGWRDHTAQLFATLHEATLAVERSDATTTQVSLSPASVRAAPSLDRLVLPSPNGATISIHLAATAPEVIGVSLRNRQAAARWLLKLRKMRPQLRVAVVAAGELWPDGSLRPAIEDLWGAGSLIAALRAQGWIGLSPEASTAADAYMAVPRIDAALGECASGRELIETGYPDDVRTAAQLDDSNTVPTLREGTFSPY